MTVIKASKLKIIVLKGDVMMGYVRSVSYKRGTFTLTQDKLLAKTYSSHESTMHDLDSIALQAAQNGYTIIID